MKHAPELLNEIADRVSALGMCVIRDRDMDAVQLFCIQVDARRRALVAVEDAREEEGGDPVPMVRVGMPVAMRVPLGVGLAAWVGLHSRRFTPFATLRLLPHADSSVATVIADSILLAEGVSSDQLEFTVLGVIRSALSAQSIVLKTFGGELP